MLIIYNFQAFIMIVEECLPNNKYRVSLMDPSTYPPSDIAERLQNGIERCNSITSVKSYSNASSDLHPIFERANEQLVQDACVSSSKVTADERCCSAVSFKTNQSDQMDGGIKIIQPFFIYLYLYISNRAQ